MGETSIKGFSLPTRQVVSFYIKKFCTVIYIPTLQSSLWESGDFVLVSIQPGCDVSIVGLVSELNLESGKYPIWNKS